MAKRNPMRFGDARRAMKGLLENPDDTAKAFEVVSALSGNSGMRLFKRFQRSKAGGRVLRDELELCQALAPENLASLPEGSLGATMAAFYAREKISAGGLAEASVEAFGEPVHDPDFENEQRFFRRLRDLHDVFHVLTGYGRDLRGEAAVLSFTVPQTRNPGIAYLVGTILLRSGPRSEMGRLIRGAFSRGRRAVWLVEQDWESLLRLPLHEVREQLRIGSPPIYEVIRSEGAPPLPV